MLITKINLCEKVIRLRLKLWKEGNMHVKSMTGQVTVMRGFDGQ